MRPTVKLGEICKIQNGYAFDSKKFNESKGFPLIRIRNIKPNKTDTLFDGDYSEEFLVHNGDFLIGMDGEFNHTIRKGGESLLNQRVCRLYDYNGVLKEYIYYIIGKKLKEIEGDTVAVTVKHISSKQILDIQIPLPSLETQKAIVVKLDQIFAELDQTKSEIQKNLDNTDELWKSALNQAFQGDWEMKKLGEVCDRVDNVKWRDNISYKYIDLTSVDRDYGNIYDTKIINSKTAPSRAKQIVKYNDILFGTTRPTQLRRCIIPIEYDNQICSTGFCVIRLKKNLIPSYLYFLLETQSFFDYVEKYQSGAGYPAISDKKLKEFCIPVPPLSEQEKIVEHLDQVSKEVKALKSQYQSQLDNLEELKKSVLNKAFRGELG